MTLVKLQQNGAIGELMLCSPKTLNALTHTDIQAVRSGLARFEADATVRAIVIRSDSERAFCAGGDMKRIREHILAKRFDDIERFFTDEYALNLAISRCQKPYIALMNGIAMGGGLGISVHGHFRVVSENSRLAMPESRIGFFADVGASYFLPKLPHRAGYWLGLTSVSVKGHEALLVGLATHYIKSESFGALQEELAARLLALDCDAPKEEMHNAVRSTLDAFSAPCPDDNFVTILAQREQWFADNSLDAIQDRLAAATNAGDEDAAQLLALLEAGSPYSARSLMSLLENASNKTLQQCLELELALGAEAVRYPDCAEGVRAVLVDKDQSPAWAR
ncbi:MAG: enoyl-CoA hydratase/isomerase family protein [Granulosicoccus sp.]